MSQPPSGSGMCLVTCAMTGALVGAAATSAADNASISDFIDRPLSPKQSSAAFERCRGFVDQFLDGGGNGFLATNHPNRLPGHHGSGFDVAVDHRSAQRSGPVMLYLKLSFRHFDRAFVEPLRD